MNLDQPQGQGRIVPQSTSGGGGFMSKLGAMVTGAFTQTLRNQNQLAMEYHREIIRTAGDKTRKDNTREYQKDLLNDIDRRRASGSGFEQGFGLRYKSGYDPKKPDPNKDTPGTPPKPRGTSTRSKGKGGTIAATVGAVKSGNIDFEQATGGEFGDEAGVSPKLSADFGAHVTAGGNQESYLAQFTPSGRRKRTPKPPKPPTPPPPGGGGGATQTATPTATPTAKRRKKADPYKEDPDLANEARQTFFTAPKGNGNTK